MKKKGLSELWILDFGFDGCDLTFLTEGCERITYHKYIMDSNSIMSPIHSFSAKL